jgi:hypothetical protein
MHSPRFRRPGRRGVAFVGVAALFASALVSSAVPAAGDPGVRLRATLQAAPDELSTPFEDSDGARWTTWPESRDFWRDLDSSSERVEVDVVGRTMQDRPLQLVRVGSPAPMSVDQAASRSVILYVCSIHGDENSGREACMQLARDMAATADPTWRRFLERTTILLLNANPDGWVANTRGNADGVDVNRDFMAAATPEGRAIVRTIRDWKPDVLNDLHEYGPNPYYRDHLLHLWPRNRQVDNGIYRLARRMNNDYSAPLVESLGYTAGIYGEYVKDGEPFRQVAGDDQARILRNYSGLQHVVGMLSETAGEPLSPEEAADEALMNRRRVEVNYTSAVGSVQMVIENRRQIERQTAAAAVRVTAEGAARSGVVYFAGQDNRLPLAASEVEPEPMCGYQLTGEQLESLRQTMLLHGIGWDRNAAGAFVTMAQPDQPLIPLLFDARSQYRLTDATPVEDC